MVAYVVGFVATLLFGVSDSVLADLEAQSASVAPLTSPGSVPLTASLLGLGLLADSSMKLATVNGNGWRAHSSVEN
ncbi:hypothetical protein [Curtobacterium sp. MCPF17_052]|uniref:hypothetical protein n=1 Tax=Curtobacterium sp. MCPF17_052 TaxID=2175655 RepID=UPI0024DFB18C|nr:hypothetical protein [Curtobacterium sp. MCPF17_052]WIB12306.1 hypothetical protein DEJ36_16595 [Curtobacterium sp. MCPF17_052]